MIAASKVEEIRQLLREGGVSQRGIARRLGVSRGTVNAIALGRRPGYERRRRGHGIIPPSGPFVRCSTCGALAQMPCLACQLRAWSQRRQRAG